MIIKLPGSSVVYERKIQFYCKRPFPAHPEGCPNFGVKKGCPPNEKLIDEIIDLEKDVFLIITEFHFKDYTNKFDVLSDAWFERENWEPLAKKQHAREVDEFLKEHTNYTADDCPEARGVNLGAMLQEQKEIKLDWTWPPKPTSTTYVISLAGFKR